MLFPIPEFADRAVPKCEVARLVGVDVRTLSNWAAREFGPRPVSVGGASIYDRDQVAVFLAAQGR